MPEISELSNAFVIPFATVWILFGLLVFAVGLLDGEFSWALLDTTLPFIRLVTGFEALAVVMWGGCVVKILCSNWKVEENSGRGGRG